MLSPSIWLGLSHETRRRIAVQFNLQKSAGTEVINSTVVSDGYTAENLAAISLERLQTLFKTDDKNFYALFDRLVKLIENAPQSARSETVGSPGITIPPFKEEKVSPHFGIQESSNEPVVPEPEPQVEKEQKETPEPSKPKASAKKSK